MDKIHHYPSNRKGRDLIVGDLHGCKQYLLAALELLQFDPNADTLYGCGDLIDRGPDSWGTSALIYEPWFKSVRGNHDHAMIGAMRGDSADMYDWQHNLEGEWSRDVNEDDLISRALDMDARMPLVISVGEGEHRFNVVHAELFKRYEPVTDAMLDEGLSGTWQFCKLDEHDMMWARDLVQCPFVSGMPEDTRIHHPTELSITYCGHTGVRKVCQVQRQVFLDTGASYYHSNILKSDSHQLTIVDHTNQCIHSYSMFYDTITTTPLSTIAKYSQ